MRNARKNANSHLTRSENSRLPCITQKEVAKVQREGLMNERGMKKRPGKHRRRKLKSRIIRSVSGLKVASVADGGVQEEKKKSSKIYCM